MTDQLDTVNAAIEAAKAAARSAPAPVPSTTGASVVPLQGGRAVSLREAVEQASMRADAFLSVAVGGFTIGKDKKNLIEEMKVRFSFAKAKPFYGVRYGQNPAKYERSYDRILNSRTKQPWADTVAAAQRIDPRCTGDYTGVDVMFELVEPAKNMKGEEVFAAGKTLLWTSSITNYADFAAFMAPYFPMIDAGMIPENAVVEGTVRHEQTESGGNTWGLLKFGDDFRVVSLGEEAQAA